VVVLGCGGVGVWWCWDVLVWSGVECWNGVGCWGVGVGVMGGAVGRLCRCRRKVHGVVGFGVGEIPLGVLS
jgi:hypothetical protein